MDRLLLNRWVSRVGNGVFLAGAAAFVWRLLSGPDPLLLVGIALMATGLGIQVLPFVRHRTLPEWLYARVQSPRGLLDARIKEGQEAREWMRYYDPSDRDARIRVATWQLKTANQLAHRIPVVWDDFRKTGVVAGTGTGQLIEHVDRKLEVLMAARREMGLN